MSELLPCPFCGGEPVLTHDDDSDYPRHWKYFVTCTECWCQAPDQKEKEDAVAAWNRRTPQELASPGAVDPS